MQVAPRLRLAKLPCRVQTLFFTGSRQTPIWSLVRLPDRPGEVNGWSPISTTDSSFLASRRSSSDTRVPSFGERAALGTISLSSLCSRLVIVCSNAGRWIVLGKPPQTADLPMEQDAGARVKRVRGCCGDQKPCSTLATPSARSTRCPTSVLHALGGNGPIRHDRCLPSNLPSSRATSRTVNCPHDSSGIRRRRSAGRGSGLARAGRIHRTVGGRVPEALDSDGRLRTDIDGVGQSPPPDVGPSPLDDRVRGPRPRRSN